MKKESTGRQFPKNRNWAAWSLMAIILAVIGISGGMMIDRFSRTTPTFCSSCHVMNEHVDSYLESNQMDHVHYLSNVGCKDCHSDYQIVDEIKSIVTYIKGDYHDPFEKIRVKDEMCLQCHISLDHQAARTDFLFRNPHQSHQNNLRCTSCHVSHGEQVDYCSGCHDNGGQRMTGSEVIPRAENPRTNSQTDSTSGSSS